MPGGGTGQEVVGYLRFGSLDKYPLPRNTPLLGVIAFTITIGSKQHC
jgi:hypothetical protein